MAWKTSQPKDCLSFLTELSFKLSLFLFGREDWTSVKKNPVLEPVYWLARRNNSHMCEKGGMQFLSHFCSLLWHAGSSIRATLSQRHLPIAGGQGQAWKGANAWGCTSLLPQHSLQVERASTGEGPSEGKCFLMCPRVSRRRSMTWPGSLEAQSFLGDSSEGARRLAVTRVVPCRRADRRARDTAGTVRAGITRSPSLRAPAVLAPFSVCLQKVRWITGGRKKERRERRKQLPMSKSKTKKITWSWNNSEWSSWWPVGWCCLTCLLFCCGLALGLGVKGRSWMWNPAAVEYFCFAMQIVTVRTEGEEEFGTA